MRTSQDRISRIAAFERIIGRDLVGCGRNDERHDKSSRPVGGGGRARGVSVEVYVEELLARRAIQAKAEGLQSVRAAVDRIIELRRGNQLAGLRTKDLIHEGRKY